MKNKGTYREAAIKLANTICRDAIWNDDTCNWIGLATEFEEGRKRIYSRALPPGLYDGVAGVIFFLLQVHRHQPHPLLLKTIKGATQQLLTTDDKEMSNGFYHGQAGIIFVLKLAAGILNDRTFDKEAERRSKLFPGSIKTEKDDDIISGAAGIILFLIHLYQHYGKKDDLLKAAISLGDKLIGSAAQTEQGLSWNTMQGVSGHLTGFAHGASGIATALIELFAVSKEERFLSAAKDVFRYEDSFFNQQKQNWPDFRFTGPGTDEAEQICSLAWCHGAPGIGLARLKAYELTGQKHFLEKAKKAAIITARHLDEQYINDHSLCHGLSGNAIFLLKIAEACGGAQYKKQVEAMAERSIQRYIHHNIPFPNGYGSDRESPCFMQGNSGIGLFYLFLYDPRQVLLPLW